jgi:metal-dependent amidase/aminoacylase/carboxypeptidase family protein
MRAIVEGTAVAHDARAKLDYSGEYPVTANHPAETAFATGVARKISGEAAVEADAPPIMGAEDFSYMLNGRPGAFIFLGIGEGPPLHHPQYNFNDDAIPVGCSYWARLVERALPSG